MIEENMKSWLLADTAIAAKLGARIFPQFIPENSTLPAVAYAMISDQALLAMKGPVKTRTPRIQLTIVARSQKESSEISELLKNRINIWEYTYSDMRVESCFAEGGVYLSLDYYTPANYGMIIEAYLNYYPTS